MSKPSLLQQVRGSLTNFEPLTEKNLAKLAQEDLTLAQIREMFESAGLDAGKIIVAPDRVICNAYYADYESGLYFEIWLSRKGIQPQCERMRVRLKNGAGSRFLEKREWKSFYCIDVPTPLRIMDFQKRYRTIEPERVFEVWAYIHQNMDYVNGQWKPEVLKYVFDHAPKVEGLPVNENGIFALCVSGLGPTQIAKRLRSEKVLTPTEYWNSIGRNCGNPPARQFNWCSDTVASILSKQEYCGDTVNFRSTTKSFKNKKKIERPQEEWQIFPNTHPAIIDRETFELVQELRQHRRRPTKSGIVSMFSGLLYCADCGEKLYYSVTNNYKREQAYFFCSSYRKNSEVCSAHYIREKVVEENVLENMRRVFRYVQAYEKEFAKQQMKCYGEEKQKELSEKRRELTKTEKRVKDIDTLIQKIYEDNAMGKISDERFATMSMAYEEEQKNLKEAIPDMQAYLETETDKSEGLQRFIDKVKQITQPTKLTPELVHEFIEKIVIHEPRHLDGKRYQLMDIYYNGVGVIRGLTPEEMEEAFQEHLIKRKHNKVKTA